jgi:hypothetical protein
MLLVESPICSRLCLPHVSLGLFTRTPFPILPGGFNFSADEWSPCGCLAVFPRLKGRGNVSLFFLFYYLVALVVNSDTVRTTIIPNQAICGWLELLCFS